MAIFTQNTLNVPKIAQNQQDWYFQNSLTLPFPKSPNFFILDHLFYSKPAPHPIDFFEKFQIQKLLLLISILCETIPKLSRSSSSEASS